MTPGYRAKIDGFLALNTVAVTGVSSGKDNPANLIFRKFRDGQYTVFPINPKASRVEDTACYPDIKSLPEKPEGVVIASPPASAMSIIEECHDQGIQYIWFHSSIDQGSLDKEAAARAEQYGMTVIPTGCPMMFVPPVDFGHKCIKWVLNLTGKVPRK